MKKTTNKKDAKAILAEIKVLFADTVAVPGPTDYKLADGTAVNIDKLEVGGVLTVAGAPAADGEYTLDDGTSITVLNGVISEVESAVDESAEDAATAEMKTPAQMQAALKKFAVEAAAGTAPDMSKVILVLKACFENVFGWQIREAKEKALRDAAIATYQDGFKKIEKELATYKKANELLIEAVETFGEQSVAAPVEPPVDWDKMSPLQRRRFERDNAKA